MSPLVMPPQYTVQLVGELWLYTSSKLSGFEFTADDRILHYKIILVKKKHVGKSTKFTCVDIFGLDLCKSTNQMFWIGVKAPTRCFGFV